MEADDSNDCFALEHCSTPASREEQQIKLFLGELKLEYLTDVFKDCGVTYGRLRYLNKKDFEEILPGRKNIGVRAEIREKLLEWKSKRPHSEETTIIPPQKCKRSTSWIEMPEESKPAPSPSIIAPPTAVQHYIKMREVSKPSPSPSIIAPPTTVQHCIEMHEESKPSPSPSIIAPPTLPLIVATTKTRSSSLLNQSNSPANKQYQTVREILQNSVKGQLIMQFYNHNNLLDEFNRKKLVNCIADNFFDATANQLKVPRTCEMEKLANEISEIFPTEDKYAYYISRRVAKKPNPMGRLFYRFFHIKQKAKKKKLNGEVMKRRSK